MNGYESYRRYRRSTIKHEKRRNAVKLFLFAAVPLAGAVLFRELPELKAAADRFGSKELYKSAAVSDEDSVYSFSERDTLSGGYMLSEGFGYREETVPQLVTGRVVLQSPLDMISSDPGSKPYPTSWGTGSQLIRTTYGEFYGDTYFDLDICGQVNNKTSLSNSYLLEESRMQPDFSVTSEDISSGEPIVLIYHTHTTESFEPYVRDTLDDSFNYRTTDETKNIVMVGDAIQAELEAHGIGVVHVRTIHDYPSYNGSYGRSRESILPVLEEYPSVKIALDIHRDAISGDNIAYQPYTEINGREAAQIMIISGCDDGTLGMPDYIKNFHFACTLQKQLEGDYPGLTRPILFDYRHYNQDLTTGSLLIEVGSHGNTLEQVQWSGQLIGRSLSSLIEQLAEEQ
ncbi:MAG: stage II sporulation protein P [Ruminococcus sp.]|nr:stage II sporulation protein P [Ruminococcus sp.]